MTWADWAAGGLKAAAYTLCVWSVLWLYSAPGHHPNANWFSVALAFLMGFWCGYERRKGSEVGHE